MKLRIFTMFTLLALLLVTFTGCFTPNNEVPTDTDSDSQETSDTSDEDTPYLPDSVRVFSLNGTTGFGLAKMIADQQAKDNSLYHFSVKADATEVTAALINGDVDIAALPTNAAANVFNKTNGGVKILAVNTLGCLYLLTKEGTTVSSMEDLRGKTVYVPAQNPTFIFTDICKKNNLIPGTDITINSSAYAQPAALREALANGIVDIAVLPEPMVTMAINAAKQSGLTITNALDLTAEWDKVNAKGSLVQGCVVVRTEFLETYPDAVELFLTEYEASIQYLQENVTEASQLIAEVGIFANAKVAETAIPKCNICYLTGNEMKSAMTVYLQVLHGINPNAIGGAMPADSFYYGTK
ncbi:MAG: ABC transporter substrate-binding protein [Ruminococcaceae bacterium]|nr:ABC transporter substrate-binding protein [Oscillospiraceae bacterium]